MAVRRDGSVWKWGDDGMGENGRIYTYPMYHQLVRVDMGSANWSSLAGNFADPMMGVRPDGSLWAAGSARYWSLMTEASVSLALTSSMIINNQGS